MDNQNLSDQQLVEACQQAHPSVSPAFRMLVERYKRQVFVKVSKIVRHPQDTEDVCQDVFIRVHEALPKFRQEASFRTWILTIAGNTSLTFIDRRKRRTWWWLTDDINEIQESRQEDKELLYLVTAGMENRELREKIDAAFKSISPAAYEILLLRYVEEMDYQSIADMLKIKLSAAKMRLKRAREEFQQNFSAQNPDIII